MPLPFQETGLWRNSLGHNENDPHQAARDRLRTAYLSMRDNAAHLVSLIPEDCKGLTVHDITHLDALWEMADLIAGDRFELNPAEAFILGGAILLHDAGMSVASYPSGLDEISRTVEWRDAAASVTRARGQKLTHDFKPVTLAEDVRQEVVFDVLRTLHAKHAEELAVASWKIGKHGEPLPLIADTELRQSYGKAIGRIAHSHHWSIERLANEFEGWLGAATFLPTDWKVDQAKIACLLRCADAAHIDERRAPAMLYALRQPRSVSDAHWRFQNKLLKPHIDDGALVYSSSVGFRIDEAAAWWLCFETIRMIDHELQGCNALLRDLGRATFLATRVRGADAPKRLATLIKAESWKPVDTAVRVSNPIDLAQSLGGFQLYGRQPLLALRELLQNAVDAIRARRALEGRPRTWGVARVVLDFEGVRPKIHVDDTGIGMSERVLCGPLLDFGRSFWRSSLVRDEFPGLVGSQFESIGRFGIGFFSVFMLGQNVSVASRRFDKAATDASVLEFQGLTSRALLRRLQDELPIDYSTRVTIEVSNEDILRSLADRATEFGTELADFILRMCLALDVEVHVQRGDGAPIAKHDGNWAGGPPEEFVRRLCDWSIFDKPTVDFVQLYAGLLSELKDPDNRTYGLAALRVIDASVRPVRTKRRPYPGEHSRAHLSMNGLCIPAGEDFFVGVMRGNVIDASRRAAQLDVPPDVLAAWSSEQAKKLAERPLPARNRLHSAKIIVRLKGDPGPLPVCFSAAGETTERQLMDILSEVDEMMFPIFADRDYSGEARVRLIGCEQYLQALTYPRLKRNVLFLQFGETALKLKISDSEEILKGGSEPGLADSIWDAILPEHGDYIASRALAAWGVPPNVRLHSRQIYEIAPPIGETGIRTCIILSRR